MQHRLLAPLLLVVGVVAGLFLSQELNAFLGIRFLPKDLPEEPVLAVPAEVATPEPLTPVEAILLPPGGAEDELSARAANALADAWAERVGQRPRVAEAQPEVGPATSRVILVQEASPQEFGDPEGFAVEPEGRGDAGRLVVKSPSRLGQAYGLYYLADLVRGGAGDATLSVARHREPAFSLRLVDMGAVGIAQDPSRWDPTNYRHNIGRFADAILEGPPYVDEAKFAEYETQFREYVHRMVAYGNNGIVMGGFLHFVNFDKVGSGYEVYPADSPFRARHAAMRRTFGRLMRYAHDMGLKVILSTDMVALTPPLEAYFQRRFGGLATDNPAFWDVYRLGLEELFEEMPYVDGIMIRIGEAGAVYNVPGWDYYSVLAVRDVASARAMLAAFLQAAEAHDKWVIFRSWSVGIGEVGDMHTDVGAYHRLLDGLTSPHLIVSTKYVMGDFYSYLPFNPTLFEGEQYRLVELQNRLEFEGFMAFPDYIAVLHQAALRTFRERNPRVIGVWQWNQSGGPQQAGPMSLYPFYGFWLWIDANAWATSQAAWDPDADPVDVAQLWVRRTFGNDPDTVRVMTQVLLQSREAVRKGLYIEPFARQRVRALGAETTPMMWIFEWDIVDASNSVLSVMYYVSRDELEAAIADGFEAAEIVRRMLTHVRGLNHATWRDPSLYEKVVASLEYEENLLTTLAWYRRAFLRYYQWLDTGDPAAYRDWQAAWRQFEEHRRVHEARYGRDLDFPAYNFFAVDIGMAHALRGPAMAWVARAVLAIALVLAALAGWVTHRPPRGFCAVGGLRFLWTAWAAPWHTSPSALVTPLDRVVAWVPALLLLVSLGTLSSFRSLYFVGWAVLGVAGFLAAFLTLGRREHASLVVARLLAALVLPLFVPMAAVAVRGPLYLWYRFWTNPDFRGVLVIGVTVTTLWTLFAVYESARRVLGVGRLAALGYLCASVGASWVAAAALPAVMELEAFLTALNNEMAILPLGLSLILGITTHLEIPPDLPYVGLQAGGVLVVLGIALLLAEAAWRQTRGR